MANGQWIVVVSLADQILRVMSSAVVLAEYPVTTSRYGAGEQQGLVFVLEVNFWPSGCIN